MQQILRFINNEETVSEGKKAPYFNIINAKGESVNLTQFTGKYLLLNFWASWSNSSKKENSIINSIYKRFGKNHFAIVNISLDTDKKQWNDAIKRDSLAGEQICDFFGWSSTTAQQYGIESLPANVLIDPQGIIIARNLKEAELNKRLGELFIENKTAN